MILSNKIALVTGASKGIGAATAERLAKEGMKVIINYSSDNKAAAKVLDTITSSGGRAELIKADISNQDQRSEMIDKIRGKYGKIDVLVNNVGITDPDDSIRNTGAFQRIFDVNLTAQVSLTAAAMGLMPSGKIIFLSSVHGGLGRGNPGVAAYSASKAALESYMKNLAKDVAPKILVNAVAPGRTLTPAWGDMTDDKQKEYAKAHLTNRWITPDEVADAITFLAKNDSMCGQVLTIDGGMSLKTLG